jgi:hypothetical protein
VRDRPCMVETARRGPPIGAMPREQQLARTGAKVEWARSEDLVQATVSSFFSLFFFFLYIFLFYFIFIFLFSNLNLNSSVRFIL